VSFSVACQRDYAGSEGGQPKTDFFGCDAWRGTAEFIAKYFDTGDMIVVSGRLQNDEWTDNEDHCRACLFRREPQKQAGSGHKCRRL
jgi:single-strand DNA-binding protein